jgi:sugar lactone lactonase YvrE
VARRFATTDLTGPNGLAFSPDERHLYVANWDEKKKAVSLVMMRSWRPASRAA